MWKRSGENKSRPLEWEDREKIAPTTDLNGFGLGNQEPIDGDEQHHDCDASQDRGAQLSPEEDDGHDNLQRG